MAYEESIAIITVSVVFFLFYIGNNFKFTVFDKNRRDKDSVFKLIIIGIGIWILPLLIQLAVEIATDNSASADVITLLEALYGTLIMVDIIISMIMGVLIILTLLMYLGVDVSRIFKQGGGRG